MRVLWSGSRDEARSCHTAIAEAKKHVRDGYEWVGDIDLEKFFDRVNQQRLLARLAQRVDDRRLLALIGQMLKAKVVLPDVKGAKTLFAHGIRVLAPFRLTVP